MPTPDDLIGIARLPDPQLDSPEMSQGARHCQGLAVSELVCARHLRPHLRLLVALTPEQRWEGMRPGGLPFTRLTLP